MAAKKPSEKEIRKQELQAKLEKQLRQLPGLFAHMDDKDEQEALTGLRFVKKTLKTINEIQKELTGDDPGLTMAELYNKIDENAGGVSNEDYQAVVEENNQLRQANETFAQTEEAYKKRIVDLEARTGNIFNNNVMSPKGLFGRTKTLAKTAAQKYQAACSATVNWLDRQVSWPTSTVRSVVNIGFGLVTGSVMTMAGHGVVRLFSSKEKPEIANVTPQQQAPQNKQVYSTVISFDSMGARTSYERMNGKDTIDDVGFNRVVTVDTIQSQPLRESGIDSTSPMVKLLAPYNRMNDTANNPYQDGFNNGSGDIAHMQQSAAKPVDLKQKNFRENMPEEKAPVVTTVMIFDYAKKGFTASYAVEPGSVRKDEKAYRFTDAKTHKNVVLNQDSLRKSHQMFFDNTDEKPMTSSVGVYDFKAGKNVARYNVIAQSFSENVGDGVIKFEELETGKNIVLNMDDLRRSGRDIRTWTIIPASRMHFGGGN